MLTGADMTLSPMPVSIAASPFAIIPLVAAIAVAGLMLATAAPAEAACVCRCVDGKPKAVCSSGTDIAPLCNTLNCPLSIPKRAPTDVSKPKPAVKPGCTVKQVYDPKTGKHEWGQLCQ